MFMTRSGNASSRTRVTRRSKPARTTSSTPASRERVDERRASNASRRAKARWSMTRVGTPAACGAREAGGVGAVRDHEPEAAVEASGGDAVEDRLQVGARSRRSARRRRARPPLAAAGPRRPLKRAAVPRRAADGVDVDARRPGGEQRAGAGVGGRAGREHVVDEDDVPSTRPRRGRRTANAPARFGRRAAAASPG